MELTTVRVPRGHAEVGSFPDISVVTGVPTTTPGRREAVATGVRFGAAPLLLIPLGQWVYISVLRSNTVRFSVPATAVEGDWLRRRRQAHIAAGVVIWSQNAPMPSSNVR